jgi:alpha-1,3-mannosyltransferase
LYDELMIGVIKSLLIDPSKSKWTAILLWLADAVLCLLIIQKIPYTEIDWMAYMQQIKQVVHGELDYSNIYGDTGPLVYPATHVWIFQVLYHLTEEGTNIRIAQYVFMAVYLVTLAVVLRIYIRAEVPPYVLPLLVLSKRLHSIYLLRLFNDCFTTLISVIAVSFLQCRSWFLACIFFSIAVSIKMNALLYLPGAGVVLLKALGLQNCLILSFPFVGVQLLTAAPFLLESPQSYMDRAFEFSRTFFYQWTVNWRFIPEKTFLSSKFSVALIVLHLTLLAIYSIRWLSVGQRTVSPRLAVKIVSLSNLIGILCARSLHYQFYSWFYWSIPLLLWTSRLPRIVALGVWVAQEYAWNVFPSTPLSSAIVVVSLALIVLQN